MKIYLVTVLSVNGESFGESVFEEEVLEAYADRQKAETRAKELQDSDNETESEVEERIGTMLLDYEPPEYQVKEVELIQ